MVKSISALVLVLLAAAFSSLAQSPEVTILAEKQHRSDDGAIHAEGGVTLESQDLRVDADVMDFVPEGADGPEIRASGNVVLRRGDDVLRCSELRLDLATGRGEFQLR